MKTNQTNNKTTLMRVMVLIMLLVAGVNKSAWAQIIASMSGDWNNTTTWVGGVIPVGTNDVIISSPRSVSIPNGYTALARNVTVNSGGGLTLIGATSALEMTGNLVLNTSITSSTGSTVSFTGGFPQTISGDANADFSNLVINKTAGSVQLTHTVSGGVNVAGNLNITNGTLNINNKFINIQGNWTNNGTFSSGPTGTVTFSGVGAQSITGATTFNNLTINNIAAVPTVSLGLSTPITVSNALTLTNGRIVLGANNLTYSGLLANLIRTINGGWIDTNSGSLIRTQSGANLLFPVGNAANYYPVTLSNSAASVSVRFGVSSMTPPPPAGSVGSWFINNQSTATDLAFTLPTALPTTGTVNGFDGSTWSGTGTNTAGNVYTTTSGGTLSFPGTREFVVTPLASNNYFSITGGTGNWGDNTTWSQDNVMFLPCNCIPPTNSTANVTIRSGTTVNLNVAANINALTIDGTLNASNNLTVNGTTTITGVFADISSANAVYTFGALTVEPFGRFTKTSGSSSEFYFIGNVVNKEEFTLTAGSPKWFLGSNASNINIQNQHPSNIMSFSHLGSGNGFIDGNVTVLDFVGGGNIAMFGNGATIGYITIAAGKTLTNNLGVNTAPTGRRLIASPRNAGNIITSSFVNNGVVEIRSGASGAEPIYNFSATTNLVMYNGASVISSPYNDIAFNGAGALVNPIIVNGNLTINVGGTLQSNSKNIDIKGNWAKNGTGVFNAGATSATVTFSGTNVQTITGTTTFHNITLNNTTNAVFVAANTDLTVTGNWINTGNFNSGLGNNKITFDGNPGQTISGTSTSFNNLQINATSSVILNSGIFIARDLTNNGIFDGTGFQVGFIISNTNQNIQGTGTTTFGNLFINKTGTPQTLTLGQSITVSNTLQLANGKIVLGTNNLTIGNTGSITGASLPGTPFATANCIVTGNTGALIKTGTTPSFFFPIGDSGSYQPITMTNINPTGASVRFGLPSIILVGGVGSWRISNPSTNCIITLNSPQGGTLTSLSQIATYNTPTVNAWTPIAVGTSFNAPNDYATTSNYNFITSVEVEFGIFTPAATSNIFYSIVPTGNYNNASSWSSTSGGTAGTVSPTFATNPIIFIEGNRTINVADVGHIATGTTINIATGSTLSFADGASGPGINLIDNLNFATGAKVRVNNNILPVFNTSNFGSTNGTIIEFAGTTVGTIPVGFLANGGPPSVFLPYQNLIISGTGAKTLLGNTTIIRDLTIESATLNSGGFDITLEGNLNAGTFGATFNTGTVTLTGNVLQTLTTNSGGLTFNNLIVNQSASNTFGVALAGGDITFNPNGLLTLTRGKIALGNNNLKMENAGTTISGVNADSYIITNGSGRLSRIIANTPTDFPVGDNANLRLVQMSSATGSVATAGFVAGAPANPTANAINVFAGTWKLSSANPTVVAFTNAATANTVKIQRLTTASTWAEEATSFTATPDIYTSTNSISMVNETTFALFEIGVPLIAPSTDIKFLPITVNNMTNKVTFSWASIANAIRYEVRIGTIEENILVWGTSISVPAAMLSYTNNNIEYDVTTYYSVRAIGATATLTSAWSSAVNIFVSSYNNPTTSLNNDISSLVKISPNPSSGDFIVDFEGINTAKMVVRVHNAQGKQVFISENNNSNKMLISLRDFANGIYLLEVQTEKGRIWKKIVKAN